MRNLPLAMAGILGLVVTGAGLATDEQTPDSAAPRAQPPEGSAATTTVPGGDLTKEEQAYLSDLKKCEALEDAEKRVCAAEVKREHGVKW